MKKSSVKSQLLGILDFVNFNRVCNIIIGNNKKSILRCKYIHNDLIPGNEVYPARFSHNLNTFFACLNRRQKCPLCKGIAPKKIDYVDFLTQFE